MNRILAQYVPMEMALLGLLEYALLFLLIYVMLTSPGLLHLLATASPTVARDGAVLAAILALTIAGVAATIGLYRPEVCLNRQRLLVNATVAGLVAFPAVVVVAGGFELRLTFDDVLRLCEILGLWLAGVLTIRLLFSLVIARARFARRILLVGATDGGDSFASMLRSRRGRLFQPVALGKDMSMLSAAQLRAQRIWGVIVAADAAAPVAPLLDSKLRGVRVFSQTAFYEQQLGRIEPAMIDASWLLFADGFASGRLSGSAKRVVDIAASLVLLVLSLPVMLVTAVLIKLDSPGPVFYRQERTGLLGRPFTLFKFRSMRTDAEAGGIAWAKQGDPRVTRIGRTIRLLRIDELPQLLNVLRGEMSMVGPRPERPHFVEQLSRVIPFYNERSYVKPGITGWAQVNYPYGASIEDAWEKLAYDLYYVKNRSLLLDLLIMLATVRVILFREGAR